MVVDRRRITRVRVPEDLSLPSANVTGSEWTAEKAKVVAAQTALARVDPGVPGAPRQSVRIGPDGIIRWFDVPVFHGREYLSGQAAEDASPGFASLIADAFGAWTTERVGGADIQLEAGEYRVTETIDLTRFTGRFGGVGCGISPNYTAHPGHATVIRWDGPADQPVIRVRDSRDVIFENFRIEGKDGVLASYGIEFYREAIDQRGTNQYLTVRDVVIGRYPWTSQGTHKGDVKSGIGFTGQDGNNDQWNLDRVHVFNPAEYGLYVQNINSYAGVTESCSVHNAGVAGVATGASIHLSNHQFFNCPTDIIGINDHIIITVTNPVSEDSGRWLKLPPNCTVLVTGGSVQLDTIGAGGKVMIAASPSERQVIRLLGTMFTPYPNPVATAADAKIEIGGVDPHRGRFLLEVKGCMGLLPQQAVFGTGAGMWASTSRGTVEWHSIKNTDVYQFRNELRHSSVGQGRTTFNYSVWDLPVSDPTILKTVAPGVFKLNPIAAPASGEVGDMYMTTAGVLKVCTAAGTPGTWVSVGAQT